MDSKITLIFGGDLYLNGSYSIDKKITELFEGVDNAILNLEAPIVTNTTNPSSKAGPSIKNGLDIFTLLKSLHVTHLSAANNHIFDYGISGLEETQRLTKQHNITMFGAGHTEESASQPVIINNSVALISAAEEEFGVAQKNTPGSFSLYSPLLLTRIKELKQKGLIVIVISHGGVEKVPLPTHTVRHIYTSCIDAGADLVVAHHPHTIQGKELHRGKEIHYSVGNFIHSVYPSSVGIVIKVEIENKKITTTSHLINLKNKSLKLTEKNKTLDEYVQLSEKILATPSLYESVLQEQASYLYSHHYKSHVTGLFAPKLPLHIKAYKLLKKLGGQKDHGKEKLDREHELVLFHLIRNASHSESIELALAIRHCETPDLRTPESAEIFKGLLAVINEQ